MYVRSVLSPSPRRLTVPRPSTPVFQVLIYLTLVLELTCFVNSSFASQISLTNTVPLTHIDQDEIKAVLAEYKLNSCDIAIRQPEATLEDLIDVIEGNRFVSSPYSSPDRRDACLNFPR